MIRHRQHPHRPSAGIPGNCLQVAIACVLDEPVLGRIPHFGQLDPAFADTANPHAWWAVLLDTVARYGCQLYTIADKDDWHRPIPDDVLPVTELLERSGITDELVGVIGCGPSPRGPWGHATVVDINGMLLHDPHPSDAGVLWLDELYMITRSAA